MPELVELLEWIDPPTTRDPLARAREAVARLHEARLLRLPGTAAELADPLGSSARVHRDTANRVCHSTHVLAQELFGIESDAAPRIPAARALLRRL